MKTRSNYPHFDLDGVEAVYYRRGNRWVIEPQGVRLARSRSFPSARRARSEARLVGLRLVRCPHFDE